MHPFVKGDSIFTSHDILRDAIALSYENFRHTAVTPTVHLRKGKESDSNECSSDGNGNGNGNGNGTDASNVNDVHLLELFHGPTFAFKDVALQFLGHVFEIILNGTTTTTNNATTTTSCKKKPCLTVLGATSGDTGSAAICGLRGRQGIRCVILYPEGKVSPVQELQVYHYSILIYSK